MAFNIEMFEYEFLNKESRMNVKFGAEFTEGEPKDVFKKGVTTGGQQALKYSAFYRGDSGHVFMLGWDHAMLIEMDEGIGKVREIYASGDSDANADVAVFDLTGETFAKLTPEKKLETVSGTSWRRYDLSKKDLIIQKLVTFSITSCSFACLWADDRKLLLVSHVAFAPPIPLFTIFKNYQGAVIRESSATRHEESVLSTRKPHLNLFASLNNTSDELGKFTADGLPDAKDYDVTAKYLLRGPYKCREDGVFAPFKTHPYVTLNFGEDGVLFGGALGFNNDPNMPIELPPFHSTLGSALHDFNKVSNAKNILAKEKELLEGRYGFVGLHERMLAELCGADAADVDSWSPWHSKYKSETVDNLMKQLSDDRASNLDRTDPTLGKERPIFLLAELTTKPKDPNFKLAFDAVMTAWRKEQMSFKFPLDLLHTSRDELRGLVTVET